MFGNKFFNKKILIYGLGLSGNSCFNYLYKKNNVKVFDDNKFLQNKKNKKFFLERKEILKDKFDYIVLSPGIDINKCTLKNYLLRNLKNYLQEK